MKRVYKVKGISYERLSIVVMFYSENDDTISADNVHSIVVHTDEGIIFNIVPNDVGVFTLHVFAVRTRPSRISLCKMFKQVLTGYCLGDIKYSLETNIPITLTPKDIQELQDSLRLCNSKVV